MSEAYIFGFGLIITLVIGASLTLMIAANNRAIDRGEQTTGGGRLADQGINEGSLARGTQAQRGE